MITDIDVMTLASGRRVGVHHFGNRGAPRTLVFCHPAPGSGAFDPDPGETARRDVHLIALDRPGYGDSDPVGPGAWSTVLGAASDIAEVLQALEIDSVGVAGWSAGGRVALALAEFQPDLVDRVAVIGTPAPDEEVPWMSGDERGGIDAMRGMAVDDARGIMRDQMSQMLPTEITDETVQAMLAGSDTDEPVLADPAVRERLVSMMRHAFAQGPGGMIDDILGYTLQPWGFGPEAVNARTLLIYGGDDPIANSTHGRWWQQRIPDARLEMMPGAGHLLAIPGWGRVVSHLAPGTLAMKHSR